MTTYTDQNKTRHAFKKQRKLSRTEHGGLAIEVNAQRLTAVGILTISSNKKAHHFFSAKNDEVWAALFKVQ